MKLVPGLIGGAIVGVLGTVVIGIPVTRSMQHIGGIALGFLVAMAVGVGLAMLAPTAGKAWRRVMFAAALLAFAFPMQFFRWSEAVTERPDQGFVDLGRGFSLMLALIGFGLGFAFLLIGWLAGREAGTQ